MVDDVEFSINEDFKQETIRLADALNLDELQAAKLFIQAEGDADTLGRSRFETCVIQFQSRRKNLLGSLKLILTISTSAETNEDISVCFRQITELFLRDSQVKSAPGGSFAHRCLTAMEDISRWIQNLGDKIQGASLLGDRQLPEFAEIINFQQTSLTMQHEDLGAILCYLVRARHTTIQDFYNLLATIKTHDKYDQLLVHYIPSLMASMSRFGSPESNISFAEAKALHERILATTDAESWSLRYLHAATITWWLGEYSGRFSETLDQTLAQDLNLETEIAAHSKLFSDALKDGAFDFYLTLCVDIRPVEWNDSIKSSLRQWLQKKAPSMLQSSTPFSDHFRNLLAEQSETFVDAFITNMPGDLRRLRVNEDQQRLRLLEVDPLQQELDLEKFILIISYTFDGRPEAARGFWSDSDSNLFGFLQWSSKRLSTPRACVFSEMLISLSQGEENAASAHRFLLNDSTTSVGKIRKSSSLNWVQILQDLQHFATEIREPPTASQKTIPRTSQLRSEQSSGEPETYSMLESYLRLAAQLAGHSSVARSWLLNQAAYPVFDLLFLWCTSLIPSRLRACAFDTIRALIQEKTPELRESVWLLLDQWMFGASTPARLAKLTGPNSTPAWTQDATFSMIGEGQEELIAFVSLLTELISPCPGYEDFNDALAFPEYLGSAHRMPGVEPYVDFVLGKVFSTKLTETQYVPQKRLLRLTCLGFVVTCLSTFSENLVILANTSNVAVDSAIRATSLMAYVRLHPFSRVMDWLFNDRVVQELFATARQDVEEVSNAFSNSPLVLGLLRSIETIKAVLEKQYTYLDIVRPLMSSTMVNRDTSVANATMASFEDAILGNLELVVNLGLYSTTEHLELIVQSLALLQKLATSPKLKARTSLDQGNLNGQSKMLSIFEMNDESERVAQSMALQMLFDDRELAQGSGSPGHIVKTSILSFLINCLGALPNRPNLAHLFLGFSCTDDGIQVIPGSPFTKNKSLFHGILNITGEIPEEEDGSLQGWLVGLKELSLEVLRSLWRNPLSTVYTMTELRSCDFLFNRLAELLIIDADTLFDGQSILEPGFLSTGSSQCCESFLRRRSTFLEYTAMELRIVADEHAPTLKVRIISALLGMAGSSSGNQLSNPSILDLFDFAELGLGPEPLEPPLTYYSGLDLSACVRPASGSSPTYELAHVAQLLLLRQGELRKTGKLIMDDEESMRTEFANFTEYIEAHNNRRSLQLAKLDTLIAWTRLVTLVIETGDLEVDLKVTFVLQTLQLILPKLERYCTQDSVEAVELARLSKTLLFSIDFVSSPLGKGDSNDAASDRLLHLFRISLRGIYSPVATSELREVLYNICYRYIVAVWGDSHTSKVIKWSGTRIIKASGEPLMDTICDDAYGGNGTCKISALLLLDALLLSSEAENSTYVIESLIRLNFVGLLVDTIRWIPSELRETAAEGGDVFVLQRFKAYGE